MTYKEVRNISINNPCTIEVPPPRVVRQFKVPGVIAWMIAAPCSSAHSAQFGWRLTVIPPRICETASKAPRLGVNAPTRTMPRETAGLKRPPETRKKIHAFTAREKPKHNEMYSLARVSLRLKGRKGEKGHTGWRCQLLLLSNRLVLRLCLR